MTIFCLRCKRPTETHDRFEVTTSTGRRRRGGTCTVYGARKSQFVAATGAGVMNKLINRLPLEMHLPDHNFTGPGTKLHKRLLPDGTPKAWSKPINRVDQAAYHHDLCYAKHKDTVFRNAICDKGFRFILSIIDVFSKYGWLVPLKDNWANSTRSYLTILDDLVRQ